MPNIEKIREVMIHVTYEPRRLEMSDWGAINDEAPCGTTACVAGWALIIEGKIPMAITPTGMTLQGFRSPADEGARILDLTNQEARELFYRIDLDGVWESIERITEGEVTREEVEAYCAAHPLVEEPSDYRFPETVIRPSTLTQTQFKALRDLYEEEDEQELILADMDQETKDALVFYKMINWEGELTDLGAALAEED